MASEQKEYYFPLPSYGGERNETFTWACPTCGFHVHAEQLSPAEKEAFSVTALTGPHAPDDHAISWLEQVPTRMRIVFGGREQ